jgi:hypothetical protein
MSAKLDQTRLRVVQTQPELCETLTQFPPATLGFVLAFETDRL